MSGRLGSPPVFAWTGPARILLGALAATAAVALIVTAREASRPTVPAPKLRVDPNTAPAEVLTALPRLGPARVGAILDVRKDAPFASLDDLDRRVKGIGPATAAALRPHLRFDHETSSPSAP